MVNRAGFEPATSALSRQRSKPAELTVRPSKYTKKIGKLSFLGAIYPNLIQKVWPKSSNSATKLKYPIHII